MVVTSCNDQGNQPDPIEPKDTIKYVCPTCPEGVPFDDENKCPLPENQNIPKFIHDALGTSINGDLLIIDQTTILNVKSLQISQINPKDFIPKEYNIQGVQLMCFSPKENSKVILSCGGYVKNEAGKTVWGRSNFIFDIDTKEIINITPSKFGKLGVNYPSGGVRQWSYDEATKTDRLHFSDTLGEYIVQEDRFINIPNENVHSIFISPNNKYTLRQLRDYYINYNYYTINGVRVKNLEVNSHTFSMAWSPDSRYLAIQGFTNTYIFDFLESDPFSPTFTYKYMINTRKQFCKYVYGDENYRQLAFLSPTTLAVSMRDHNGDVANLHEITIDGKYVRQLTFVK